MLTRGTSIVAYQDSLIKAQARSAKVRRLKAVPDQKAFVVNATVLPSELGPTLSEKCTRSWSISLRSLFGSNDAAADVSEIARKFGGGGHRAASGCAEGPAPAQQSGGRWIWMFILPVPLLAFALGLWQPAWQRSEGAAQEGQASTLTSEWTDAPSQFSRALSQLPARSEAEWEVVSEFPRIFVRDDFLSFEECNFLKEQVAGRLQPAKVVEREENKYDQQVNVRNNQQIWLGYAEERDTPAGEIDMMAEHAACQVKRGEKWIAQRWFRYEPYQRLVHPPDVRFDGLPMSASQTRWTRSISQKSPSLFVIEECCNSFKIFKEGGMARHWVDKEVQRRLEKIIKRMHTAVLMPEASSEPLQIGFYEPGSSQGFHFDSPKDEPNPRLWTVIVYLDGDGSLGDNAEGATIFPSGWCRFSLEECCRLGACMAKISMQRSSRKPFPPTMLTEKGPSTMGVQGLWDLASPAGQRVNFSALENKVVAVDASIWMYHFLKAMRDDKGDMVKGAHLIGFFRRICKLLYLKIRPVFVFDGPPPALKWKTLQLRAKQRDSEERQRRKAVERLLRNQLQQHLLQAASAAQPGAEAPAEAADATRAADEDLHATEEDTKAVSSQESVEEALPASSSRSRRRNGVPVAFRGFMAQRRGISQVQVPELPSEPLREILNVPNRRPHGRMRPPDEWKGYSIPGGGMVTEFEQLDPKTKYLLLQRAQEAWFGESRLKAVEAKDDMGAFVNVQLEMFLRHIRTNKEIEKVKRSMAEQASRPAGDELADGEVYRAPSFLQAEREQPQASQAVEEFGQVESVIGNKGKGKRGRRSKRPRQLANEPTRWQPLSGVGIKRNSDPMVWFSEAQDEAESHSEESHSPKAKPQEVETAEDLFGNEFFEAEEAAKRRKVPEPEVFQVHAPSATTTDSLMDDSLAEAFSPHPSSPLSDGAVFADIGEEDLAPPSPSFDTAMDEVEAVEVFSPKRQPPSALAADTFEPANFPSPAGEPTVPAQAVFVQDTFEPANFPSPEREPAVPAQAAFVEDTSEHANFPSPARELTVPAQSASVEDTSEPANFPSPEREPTVPARAAFVEDTSERANFPSPARREPTVSAQAKTVAAAAAAAAAPAPRPSRSDTEDPSKSVWCNTHFQYRWRCHQDGVAHVCDAQERACRDKGLQHLLHRALEDEEKDVGMAATATHLEFQRLAAELEDEHRDLRAEARRAKRGADVVTPEMQADVEALLEALGIPFVHAPAEAEAQCAFLAEAHLVDAVASDDSDVLVFGAREVYRRMFSEDASASAKPQVPQALYFTELRVIDSPRFPGCCVSRSAFKPLASIPELASLSAQAFLPLWSSKRQAPLKPFSA
eukprot:g16090.t1